MDVGLLTMADMIGPDPITGYDPSYADKYGALVETAVAADEAGFSSINLGEHHAIDMVISAPPVLLAAFAERTKRIRLGTAVTLMSNLDPYRVVEDYATVDVLSAGRVEVIAGRGQLFKHNYELFGQPLEESRERFAEGLELFVELWENETVDWQGRFRPAISGFGVVPRPVQASAPLSIAGGLSAESPELAARLGIGLVLPTAFGMDPNGIVPTIELFEERWAQAGHSGKPPVGAAFQLNVARTSQAARERWEPRYRFYAEHAARTLGPNSPAMTRGLDPFDFDFLTTQGGAIVGSPQEVGERLSNLASLLHLDRVLLQIDMATIPTGELVEMIELIGSDVIPDLQSATTPAR